MKIVMELTRLRHGVDSYDHDDLETYRVLSNILSKLGYIYNGNRTKNSRKGYDKNNNIIDIVPNEYRAEAFGYTKGGRLYDINGGYSPVLCTLFLRNRDECLPGEAL